MLCSACRRSSSRVRELTSTASGCSVPETTLQRDILPVWLSLKVFVTVSTVGPAGSQGISTVSVPAVATSGGREPGVGQSSSISRASRSTPTPLGGRAAQDGEHGGRGDAAGQALLELGVVERLAVEVALHEVVVAHHDALDELLVHGVLLVDEVVGDGPLVADGGTVPSTARAGGGGRRSGWPCRRAGR